MGPSGQYPAMRTILAYRPDSELQAIKNDWGYQLREWSDPAEFRAEAPGLLPEAALIVIGHGEADWLADFEPVCPVVCAQGSELLRGGWPVLVDPQLPVENSAAIERMRGCLTGLAVGDALGERLSHSAGAALQRLSQPDICDSGLYHTDDTEMALALSSVLRAHGKIYQGALVARFVRRFQLDPDRGYGKMTRIQLRELGDGAHWRSLAQSAFGGQGSMGNGSAMRVAPLGAYFAGDLERCIQEARASSEVTHTHPEAIAGSIAVAVAAALSCSGTQSLLDEVVKFVPPSQVLERIRQAREFQGSHLEAARLLGNGFQVSAQDTVPFCLWIAAHCDDYVQAIGQAIEADGDCDTCAAITGALMALKAPHTVPSTWKQQLEPALRAF